MIGKRVSFWEDLGHKRCMVIEVEYSGAITSLQGTNAQIAVDFVDGMNIDPPVLKTKSISDLQF